MLSATIGGTAANWADAPGDRRLEECCASTSYRSVSCEAEYKLGRLLGDGSQGAVYQATRRSTGEEVALKVVDIPAGEREASVMRNVEEEFLALRGCSHRSGAPPHPYHPCRS